MLHVCFLDTASAKLPTRKTRGSAGYDLCATSDCLVVRGEIAFIHTGIALEIPEGYYGDIKARSSLARLGITVRGGVIDSDYRGEIVVMLGKDSGGDTYDIKKGDSIAQIVFQKYEELKIVVTSSLSATQRNAGGFGSTGK